MKEVGSIQHTADLRNVVQRTNRLLPDWLREHVQNLKKVDSDHLSFHCRKCACEQIFHEAKILGGSWNKSTHEIWEAYHVKEKGTDCVSNTCISHYKSEIRFLFLMQHGHPDKWSCVDMRSVCLCITMLYISLQPIAINKLLVALVLLSRVFVFT